MYTILNGLSPYIMQEIPQTKSYYYNNRDVSTISARNIKIITCGLQTICHIASKVLGLLHEYVLLVTHCLSNLFLSFFFFFFFFFDLLLGRQQKTSR